MVNILLITDSRGRDIKSRIQTHQDLKHLNLELQYYPEATLETIQKKIERLQRGCRNNIWDHIIVIAGICNFTTRTKDRDRKPHIAYSNRNTEAICHTIDTLLNIHENIHICTITPAVLHKASDRQDTDIESEQLNLEEDISEVNQHIINQNIQKDRPTFDLAKLSTIRSVKKQGPKKKRIIRLNQHHLEDGVHPSSPLQELWIRYIKNMVIKITNAEYALEDDNTEDEDSGNFKRQPKN